MSAKDRAERLRDTFEAYMAAEREADRVFLDYKFLNASEREVHRHQRYVAEARAAHLIAIADTALDAVFP